MFEIIGTVLDATGGVLPVWANVGELPLQGSTPTTRLVSNAGTVSAVGIPC